jgi:hypothetical protein
MSIDRRLYQIAHSACGETIRTIRMDTLPHDVTLDEALTNRLDRMPCDAQTCTTLATFPRSCAASASGPRVLFLFEQTALSTRALLFDCLTWTHTSDRPGPRGRAFRSGSMDVSVSVERSSVRV